MTTKAEAIEILGCKPDEVKSAKNGVGGTHVTTADGMVYIIDKDDNVFAGKNVSGLAIPIHPSVLEADDEDDAEDEDEESADDDGQGGDGDQATTES